jgi:type VI secretion system protein ImpA
MDKNSTAQRAPRGELLNLDSLLAPFAGDNPSGLALNYEGTYDAIQAAREEDDPSLPQGVWERPLRRADWPEVARLCETALGVHSKDLQIAAWLVEACFQLHGLDALARGLGLIRELCERYWDSVHPLMRDGESEYRSAPIYWLDTHLSMRLRFLLLVPSAEGRGGELTLAHWERALRRTGEGEAQADTAVEDRSCEAFLAAAAQAPSGFYHDLVRGTGAALREAAALEAHTDERFDLADAPSLRVLRGSLQTVQELATRILRARAEEPTMSAENDSDPKLEPVANETRPPVRSATQERFAATPGNAGLPTPEAEGELNPIRSRAEAFEHLREAGEYLLRTEPHSPVPYLVLRAVGWGERSLPELLGELVYDQHNLGHIYTLLGIDGAPMAQSPEEWERED